METKLTEEEVKEYQKLKANFQIEVNSKAYSINKLTKLIIFLIGIIVGAIITYIFYNTRYILNIFT